MAMNTITITDIWTWYEITDGAASVSGTIHNRSDEDVFLFEGSAAPTGDFDSMPSIVLEAGGERLWQKKGAEKLYAACEAEGNLELVFNPLV